MRILEQETGHIRAVEERFAALPMHAVIQAITAT
jgi:hypothetical protein